MNNKNIITYTPKAVATYVIWFVIFCICSVYLVHQMTFIEINEKPSITPPWYFILNDLRASFAALIGITLSFALAIFYYRKKDIHFGTIIFFSLAWYGHDIGNGISIMLNTTNVFNHELATTKWSTHEQYLSSAWNSYIFYILLFLSAVVFIYLNNRIKKSIPTN